MDHFRKSKITKLVSIKTIKVVREVKIKVFIRNENCSIRL